MVKDYQLVSHLNMAKVHRSVHSGIFECEGKPLHGKKFIPRNKCRGKRLYGIRRYYLYFFTSKEKTFFESGENWLNTIMANVLLR